MVLEVHYVSKLYKKVGRVENEKYIIFALADPILSGRDDERLIACICLIYFYRARIGTIYGSLHQKRK